LLVSHEGSESLYLLIDVPPGNLAIPHIGLPIGVMPGYVARIEAQQPTKMRRKSTWSASIEASEITAEKVLRVQHDDQDPRSPTLGRGTEWAGCLDQMSLMCGARQVSKIETGEFIVG
jgi:hypothetical protein